MAGVWERTDVGVVGAGIMGATLATLLAELDPGLSIRVFERLDGVGLECAEAMNNAGTGHAANCELNYTPAKADGSVEITKALSINASFEASLQLWSHLVEKGVLRHPQSFLTPVPHLSAVWGGSNVDFLRARQARLSAHPMFQDMVISEDRTQLREWMPLMMQDRETTTPLAATRVARGTDLDFGSLTQSLFKGLEGRADFHLHLGHEVRDLKRDPEGGWRLKVVDLATGRGQEARAGFVFLGAGGGSLPLLLKSGIEESKGYGGFPVSGQWLVCTNESIVAQHQAKVYGKASLGAPPMSVPHLDTRSINGKQELLFGPYAGFTTRFLKSSSLLDFPLSFRPHNVKSLLWAGWHNLDLTRYLVGQVVQSMEHRMKALREFMPQARREDWRLEIAGQRVQIIKRDPEKGGKLEFGTEVVAAADGSLAALLGASPGASTAVTAMVDLIQRCFLPRAKSELWQTNLRRMIPSHGGDLTKDVELLKRVRSRTNAVLGLKT